MGFQTGLTGLNVFSKTLDVIGNNIANSNTVGMKTSRTEYADLASVQPGSRGGSGIGFGVSIATTAQQLQQRRMQRNPLPQEPPEQRRQLTQHATITDATAETTPTMEHQRTQLHIAAATPATTTIKTYD